MNQSRTAIVLQVAIVSLAAVTTWFFHVAESFTVVQPALITNADMGRAPAGWTLLPPTAEPPKGELVLVRVKGEHNRIRAITRVMAAPGARLLQVQISAKRTENTAPVSAVVIGRADVYGRSGDNPFVWFNSVGLVTDSPQTQQLATVVAVPDNVEDVQLEVESVSPIAFSVLSVSVHAANVKSYRPVVQPVLMGLWGFVGLVALFLLWTNRQRHLIAGGAMVLAVLLLIPEPLKLSLQSFFAAGFESADHVVLFFLLGLLVFYRDRTGWWFALLFVLSSELLQNFTTHREVLWSDVLANLAGLFTALVVCELFRLVRSRLPA